MEKKLTIGMACYDDYDGVYFSLQAIRMYHPGILDKTNFLVIDNNPTSAQGKAVKKLIGGWIPNAKYVPYTKKTSTSVRNEIFNLAETPYVVSMDCHVLFEKGALRKLIEYYDKHPNTKDIIQGPLVYDDLKNTSTQFNDNWRGGMWGTWGNDPRGKDPNGPPFDIPMQGLGVFSSRKEAWPGFNDLFRGFGGEEGYIHEKFRQAGGRSLCLPSLRWVHRFGRPAGIKYPVKWEDRVWNYFVGYIELGLDVKPIYDHFDWMNKEKKDRLYQEAKKALGK